MSLKGGFSTPWYVSYSDLQAVRVCLFVLFKKYLTFQTQFLFL